MAKREIKFERDCIKKLRLLPNSYWPDKVDPGSIRGTPDRIGCVNSTYVCLEFKRSMAEMIEESARSNLQEYVLKNVQEAGGFATFVCPETWDRVYRRIKEIANAKRN